MKNLILITILCALCICIGSVAAAHDYYEVRPTIDSNPVHQQDYKMQQQYGYIKVILRCGGNTLSPNVVLKNEDANVSKVFSIDANGQFDDEFSVGNYSVYLPDGNGGQPEPVQYLTVNPQKVSYAVFLGHAISPSEECKPVYTIKEAMYGFGATHGIIIHHGNYDRKFVPTVPAVPGYCSDRRYNNERDCERAHKHWTDEVPAIPGHYEYTYVGDGNGDYVRNCWGYYQYVAPTDQTVIDGVVIDVTENVQQAVNSGATELMFFNNARNPGGIFNAADELVSQINDPAPGFVKNVVITYENGCGLTRTISTEEYVKINLETGSVEQ